MAAATTTESKKKMVTLRSSDGEEFEIEEAVAMQSQTIRHLIEDECADSGIPLPNVDGRILSKVIEYCKKHVYSSSSSNEYWHDDKMVDDELMAWDADFVKVDQSTLFDVILAANYLDIKSLLDLTCKAVADMMRGKTPEEIRKIFHIKNDYTPRRKRRSVGKTNGPSSD